MINLLELTAEERQDWFTKQGLPGFRADQVIRWIMQRRAAGFEEMTDLPLALREKLAEEMRIFTSEIIARRTAADGTEKLLLELSDRERIECVLLCDDRGHRTVCISTQVGCAMGCAFCASGLDGLVRNLSCGEIVEQMLHLQRLLPDEQRISHVVVMGMGEPTANLDNLLPALAVATIDSGLGISARRITISTVGRPEGIRRLAEVNCQYHLAVSLHAADDRLRNRLVRANRKTGIAATLAAADDYFAATGRRVTYEYVLLHNVNDRAEDARRLAALLKNRNALVNLIPFNPVAGLEFRPPTKTAVDGFMRILRDAGVNVAVRYRKGDSIDAACGQLRRGSLND